jgi:DNA polymerase-3 subunit alpha
MEMAEIIDAKLHIDYHAALLPDPGVPEKFKGDQFAYIKALCLDGWTWRSIERRSGELAARRGVPHGPLYREYIERMKYELTALKRQKFVPYFLIIHDLYRFARGAGIMCGPGRGSVGGSLVAYLLGITSVDPIEHGLIFERFLSPERIDMPDCDMDFEDRRRHEIIEYLIHKYGRDKVSQIATIGKLSGKQCIRDVSRVLEIPLIEVNQVTNSIIERSSGDERASQTIADSFKDFEVCREFDKRHPKVLYHAKHLEGLAKNLGIHAAGVVTSPVPLTELLPLEIRKHNGQDVIVTALDMYGAAAVGLVKLDVLGLRTLTVIKECLEAIEAHTGKHIDLEHEDFNLNDRKVLDAFTAHDYGGIFQYDTPGADKICNGVKFTNFEDVAAMTALNRPGTARSGLASKFVERKKNPKLASKVDFHPKVSAITSDTLGIIVYQEHVLRIFTECAGFAPATADSLRKTIAKKIGDETLGKERENFVAGCAKTSGIDAKTANKIMDAITFFGSYGFNKSHATEYGMIAFWSMFLKVYYPLEFFWALLKNEPDRIRVAQLAKDVKKHDIKLMPPHVNVSRAEFSIDREHYAIRGSLVDIKGVGEAAAGAIMASQPFKDFFDFVGRVDRRKVHKGVILALTKCGALGKLIPSTKWFVENLDAIWALLAKNKMKEVRALFDAAEGASDYGEEDASLLASSVNPLAFGKHPIDAYGEFISRVIRVPLVSMSNEDFFKDNDGKGVYIAGVIVEVKYNQIGDFHNGTPPTELEKHRMFWGARYANVNIEDAGGKQNRTKFDIDIFNEFRPLIDSGIGTPVIAHVLANAKFENLRAQFAVDLSLLRKKLSDGAELSVWEMLVTGRHPAVEYPWKDKETAKKRITNAAFRASKGGAAFTGVVTHVRLKYDKNDNLMAFFGLLGGDGLYIDVIAFASTWQYVKGAIKSGRLVRCEVEKKPERGFGWSHFCGNRVKVLKKSVGKSAAEFTAE